VVSGCQPLHSVCGASTTQLLSVGVVAMSMGGVPWWCGRTQYMPLLAVVLTELPTASCADRTAVLQVSSAHASGWRYFIHDGSLQVLGPPPSWGPSQATAAGQAAVGIGCTVHDEWLASNCHLWPGCGEAAYGWLSGACPWLVR
jgi:hypothetical protein